MVNYFILSLLIVISVSSCQTFKLNDAIKREDQGEYYEAAQKYRKIYAKTSPKRSYLRGSIAFHMAECYRKVNDSNRALNGYKNALHYHYSDSIILMRRAQMMHKLGKYNDAIKQYKAFLEIFPNNILAINSISGCELAIQWRKNPSQYIVKKTDNINSCNGEFSPLLHGKEYDELYITSSRKEALGGKSPITGRKKNDFFIIKQDEKKQWKKPEHIKSALNTKQDEGSASFTLEGSQMYFTFCPEGKDISLPAEIHISSQSGTEWSKGQKVKIFNDSTFMAAHPAVGVDGYLYFVSDIKGGYGGKDIWRVPINQIGMIFPENLGPEINTSGDEVFPYMRNDSTLYFSSDGHPGIGGLDIFKAINNNGHWLIENMKTPINSAGDDFGITFMGTTESGFFSSNRNDERGFDHIYSFSLPDIYVFVKGWVLNYKKEIMEKTSVRIVGTDGTNQQIATCNNGSYSIKITPGTKYVMMASAPGYFNQKQTLITSEERNKIYLIDFNLSSCFTATPIENIFYDFNKSNLRAKSKKALQKLIIILKSNSNIAIQLSAHSDRKGSDEYNNNLSQRRAQSVMNYLITFGKIEPFRLTAKGYGKSFPTTVTKNIAQQYDFLPEGQLLNEEFLNTLEPIQQIIADQINRRTEFTIISTANNYKLM